MVRYSDELLEEIRSRNDIVDIISQYVTLKRSGRNFFGLCPFHKEKSPSFSVSPDKQIFHCFGCGVGGNVFHFISKIENVGFMDSVQILAERANIELPTSGNVQDDKLAYLKSRVYEINKKSAEFYHKHLYDSSSKDAQEYIKKRKLDNNTLKSFMIGFSGNFNELYKYLHEQGFSDEEILASSLVNKNKDGTFIDRFRHRLMFPIQDTRNRFIAFGGRVLDDSKPKYINSPENIVYSKGRNLFGLNVAKKANIQMKKLLIVEGYMDAISLYQRGITNVVASLGTAMTEAQGRLLRSSCEQVILGYDADGAGQAAILRGLEILRNLGCDIRVLQISGAKDPDEYVVKYGPERLQKCIDNAISLVEYKVKTLTNNLNLENVSDKIKFLNEVAKILIKLDNTMEREVYIDKIAKTYDISQEAIYAEVNKGLYNAQKSEKILEAKPVISVKSKEPKKELSEAILRREKMVIYLTINYPEKSEQSLMKTISPQDMQDEKSINILQILYDKIQKGENMDNVLDWFEDEQIVNYISGILAYDFEITEVDKAIEDLENTYKRERLNKEKDDIVNQLAHTENMDKEQIDMLENTLSQIIIDLAKMGK